ncbi:hypothetical protein NDU88_004490 [Pleurodeles waltl]|uniref:Uncharacterized protein n=1 Tax=Pleurodeles waltl TaxID=8319 RepID=A0AAV7WS06_PLEWA|nr:hypothetical protein NDU88_004490 [Pleurodeles waltl]
MIWGGQGHAPPSRERRDLVPIVGLYDLCLDGWVFETCQKDLYEAPKRRKHVCIFVAVEQDGCGVTVSRPLLFDAAMLDVAARKGQKLLWGDADRNRLSETDEYDGRNGEWLKDGGDKFYSLTEESEAASSGYVLNEEDGSGSSEAESLAESMSPVVGPTVRPQRRHHKRIMSRTGEQVNNMASSDTKILQLIYGTVRELQTETRAENRKAPVANKQLQVTVQKIAKS